MSIIEVEQLGKKYLITHAKRHRYATLRDVVNDRFKNAVEKIRHPAAPAVAESSREEFWALKDVSFNVQSGERIGIIGRNGAGKSTLLKILSRITEPTAGKFTLRGRVASLLEVGTGFHPELTGHENIFLNGALLGMTRSEIRNKIDAIVSFAEVEKFLDTPVKRYSSGMYLRLAFAIAAHLDPEILVVDEVLAVGDAQFQNKCLGKMEEVSQTEGRTVLFVSHNMSMIERFCDRAILLESGRLTRIGAISDVVNAYLRETYGNAGIRSLEKRTDRTGSGKVRASGFRVLSEDGKEASALQSGKNYLFEIEYTNYTQLILSDVVISLDIHDEKGNKVLLFRTNFTKSNVRMGPSRGCILCKIRNLPLANGSYRFNIFMSHADAEVLDRIENAASMNVEGGDFFGTGSPGLPKHCKILMKADWSST